MVDDPDEFVQSYAAEKIKDIFDEGDFLFWGLQCNVQFF